MLNENTDINFNELPDYGKRIFDAANKGNVGAMTTVGNWYANGNDFIKKNIDKAIEWYTKAFNVGSIYSATLLGYIYSSEKKDYDKSIEWHTKAANGGSTDSAFYLFDIYYYGAEQNLALANEMLQNAANEFGDDTLVHLARRYYNVDFTSKAIKWYTKAANNGNAKAMLELYRIYYYGEKVEKDIQKADEWYQKAASQKDIDPMFELGEIYYGNPFEIGNEGHLSKALEWYTKSADAGNPKALMRLGSIYFNGNGVKRDYQQGLNFYEKAANAGSIEAMMALGALYCGHIAVVDKAKSLQWYKKAADLGCEEAEIWVEELSEYDQEEGYEEIEEKAIAGNLDAICKIFEMYETGDGVQQDSQKASEWFKKACDLGGPEFMIKKGDELFEDGYDEDFLLAARWYKKPADAGDVTAMYKLGALYNDCYVLSDETQKKLIDFCAESKDDNLKIISRRWLIKAMNAGSVDAMVKIGEQYEAEEFMFYVEDPQAMVWYQKAADAGSEIAKEKILQLQKEEEFHKEYFKEEVEKANSNDVEALNEVGLMYFYGRGVEKDYGKAMEYFQKAAEKGHANAIRSISRMYREGKGVEQDSKLAEQWWEKYRRCF